MVVKAGSAVSWTPADGVAPAGVDADFGAATDQGSGNKMGYNGSGASFTLTGLAPTTTYYVKVFEYNGAAAAVNYLTNGTPLAGSQITLAVEPTAHASSLAFTLVGTNRMTLNWTRGDGSNRIVVVKAGSEVSWTPADGTAPSGVSSNLATATDQGSGNKICYDGSGAGFGLIGLAPATTYYVKVFEYNGGTSTANYYTNAAPLAGNQSTLAIEPTTHATSLAFSSIATNQMTLTWARGNGSNRVVVVKAGSAVTWTPADGVAPSGVNGNFGSAADQGDGNKIGYDGSGTNFTLSGLAADTTYYVRIFEYNGSDAAVNYYTNGTPLAGSQATMAGEPTVHASGLSFASLGTNRMTVLWTSGDGSNRIVVVKAGSAVTWTPTDGVAPSGVSGNFSTATDQGGGNKICYNSNGAIVSLTGLAPTTTYYVKVFEYNGSGSLVNYLTNGTPLSGSQITPATALPPPYTLTAGDVAVIVLQGDSSDQFAFVALNDIPAETQITFANNHWSGSWATADGAVTWSHSAIVKAGTVVTITGTTTASLGSVYASETGFALGVAGEHILAFTGEWDDRPTTEGSTNWLWVFCSTTKESCPTALDAYATYFASEMDDQYYTTATGTNTASGYWAVFTNGANYTRGNAYYGTLPSYNLTVLASQPGVAADNPTFSSIATTQMVVSWTGGSGSNTLVVCRQGAAPSADPADGRTYAAAARYGSGTALGGGYVVYRGSSSNVTVNGLSAGETYYFQVYEFNGTDGTGDSGLRENYKTDTFGAASQGAMAAEPTAHAAGLSFSGVDTNRMTVTWTSGNGSNRIVVVRSGATVSWAPADGVAPSGVNADFSAAADQGSGHRICYNSNGSTFLLTGLAPTTTYYVKIFEYNGAGTLVNYYTNGTPLAGSQATLAGGPNVDGDGSDWLGVAPGVVNASTISAGEFIVADKQWEARADSDHDSDVDLTEFRVYASPTHLYFLARFRDLTDVAYPCLAIGVDADRVPADSAMTWLGDDADTALGAGYEGPANAHYPERNILVHTVNGVGQRIELYADDGSSWYAPPTSGNDQVNFSAANNLMEFRIARADLGLTGSCTGRFTVAAYHANVPGGWANDGDTTADFATTDALDALNIVKYGYDDGEGNASAWDEELADGDVDTWFDIALDGQGVVTNLPPAAPAAMSARVNGNGHVESTDGLARFTWNKAADANDHVTSYLVEINHAAWAENAAIIHRENVASNAWVLDVADLAGMDSGSYNWRVRARDASGALSAASDATFTVSLADDDAAGPVPTLAYLGVTNYNGVATNTTITDAELANPAAPIDFAVRWTDPSGIFLTNLNASCNIVAADGRVTPNWEVWCYNGSTTQRVAGTPEDNLFSNRFLGCNGVTSVTTYQNNAFTIGDFDATNTYYITLSAEDMDNDRGAYADAVGMVGDDVPYDRAVRTNYLLTFLTAAQVRDDDTCGPAMQGLDMVVMPELIRCGFFSDWIPHAEGNWTDTDAFGEWAGHGMATGNGTASDGDGRRAVFNTAGDYLVLPPVDYPAQLTLAAYLSGAGVETISVERAQGAAWTRIAEAAVDNAAAYENYAFQIYDTNTAVTLRVHAVTHAARDIYFDDVRVAGIPVWTNLASLDITFLAARDRDPNSGIYEYRRTALDATAPSTPADGDTLNDSTNFTLAGASLLEGIHTGYVFAVDNDQDRANDRAKGPNAWYVLKIDRTPPAQPQNLHFVGVSDYESQAGLQWDTVAHDNLAPWHSYRVYWNYGDHAVSTTDQYYDVTRYAQLGMRQTNMIVITNLISGQRYGFAVAGLDLAGNHGTLSAQTNILMGFLTVTRTEPEAASAVKLSWTGVEAAKTYDVIYSDAAGYSDIMTNSAAWGLLGSTNTLEYTDHNPHAMGDKLRFYRVAYKDHWNSGDRKKASLQVYVGKRIRLYSGRNWVALPGTPDDHTVAFVFGTNLPANDVAANATRISWMRSGINGWDATQQVYLTAEQAWRYSLAAPGHVGALATNAYLPDNQSFIVDIPAGVISTQIFFTGRLPLTNDPPQVTILGGSNSSNRAYTYATFNLPADISTNMLNSLLAAGFGAWRGSAPVSDALWTYNKISQRNGPQIFYKDNRWQYFDGAWKNYYNGMIKADDGIVIRSVTNKVPFTWTPPRYYQNPSSDLH